MKKCIDDRSESWDPRVEPEDDVVEVKPEDDVVEVKPEDDVVGVKPEDDGEVEPV